MNTFPNFSGHSIRDDEMAFSCKPFFRLIQSDLVMSTFYLCKIIWEQLKEFLKLLTFFLVNVIYIVNLQCWKSCQLGGIFAELKKVEVTYRDLVSLWYKKTVKKYLYYSIRSVWLKNHVWVINQVLTGTRGIINFNVAQFPMKFVYTTLLYVFVPNHIQKILSLAQCLTQWRFFLLVSILIGYHALFCMSSYQNKWSVLLLVPWVRKHWSMDQFKKCWMEFLAVF